MHCVSNNHVESASFLIKPYVSSCIVDIQLHELALLFFSFFFFFSFFLSLSSSSLLIDMIRHTRFSVGAVKFIVS